MEAVTRACGFRITSPFTQIITVSWKAVVNIVNRVTVTDCWRVEVLHWYRCLFGGVWGCLPIINQARKRRDRWVSARPWRIGTGTGTSAAVAAELATYPGNAPSPGLPARSILEGHLGPFGHPSLWPPAIPQFMWITWKLIGVKHKQVLNNPPPPTKPLYATDTVAKPEHLTYYFYPLLSF